MTNLFRINKGCRLCKSTKLSKIVSIGDSPISEKYSNRDDKEKKQNYVIVFAWEHTKKIINNHKKFIESSGKFISLFPNF